MVINTVTLAPSAKRHRRAALSDIDVIHDPPETPVWCFPIRTALTRLDAFLHHRLRVPWDQTLCPAMLSQLMRRLTIDGAGTMMKP